MNRFIICIIFGLFMAQSLTAQTGKSIMEKSKLSAESDNQEVTFTLDLINGRGKKRSQQSVWSYLTDKADNRYSFFRFLEPADVKGTGFLSIESPNKEDDRWLFLPILGKSRRISSNEKSDRFMGSDFTYEDLERTNLIDFNYELMEDVSIDGESCYQINVVANNPTTTKESGYSKRIYYVHKNHYQVIKIDFYNKKEQLSKVLIAKDIKKVAGTGFLRAHYLEMLNIKSKHKSVLNFTEFKINSDIKKEIFTVRNLEKI